MCVMMVVEDKAEVGWLQEVEGRLASTGQPPTERHSLINWGRGLVPRADVCPIRDSGRGMGPGTALWRRPGRHSQAPYYSG